ncbi:MAG: sulfurtransferase TusA family protein [Alphaproteobacteria bacterium]|nr:sulfurtransferase TusA family protein [Alphaproteobacteria bacterium]
MFQQKKITYFDAQGMKCPLPVLRVRKIMQSMFDGEQIHITVDDPKAPDDFKHFCHQTGYKLIQIDTEEKVSIIILQK